MRGINKTIITECSLLLKWVMGSSGLIILFSLLCTCLKISTMKGLKMHNLVWPPRYIVKTKARFRTCGWYAIIWIRKKLKERPWMFACICIEYLWKDSQETDNFSCFLEGEPVWLGNKSEKEIFKLYILLKRLKFWNYVNIHKSK